LWRLFSALNLSEEFRVAGSELRARIAHARQRVRDNPLVREACSRAVFRRDAAERRYDEHDRPVGTRANYALTPKFYAAAGGVLLYLHSPAQRSKTLGLQGAVGYRMHLTGPQNALGLMLGATMPLK
jgi:hypothetical protein